MRRRRPSRAAVIAAAAALVLVVAAGYISISMAARATLTGSFRWQPGDDAGAMVVDVRLNAALRHVPERNCALYISVSYPAAWLFKTARANTKVRRATVGVITSRLAVPDLVTNEDGTRTPVRQDWRLPLTSGSFQLAALWRTSDPSADVKLSARAVIVCTYNIVMSWVPLANATAAAL